MSRRRVRWAGALFIFVVVIVAGAYVEPLRTARETAPPPSLLTKDDLSDALRGKQGFVPLPSELKLAVAGKLTDTVFQYSFDAELQATMEGLFKAYGPDYGALVAIDASTGRILSMVSHTQKKVGKHENLALRATFPSASVFKVVTAAAAIAERNFKADTVISFNGRNHTLYRGQILRDRITRWTRYITLREAFGRSINTVFGKIGVNTVGADGLRAYAGRFGFNRKIAADIPVEEGRVAITDDPYELAETASGYTKDSTMSPLQGALIAAAVVNDGVMMEPYIVQSVHGQDGTPLYAAEARVATMSVDGSTAAEIRSLMRETVTRGTSRRSFRGFFRGQNSILDVGGKTGSLSGTNPPGKYDWFVGFAEGGERRMAIAVLTVNEKFWKVKSSYLARRAIEKYFKSVK